MTMPELHLDFETRSAVDLLKVGLYVYANHPTTDVWCCVWALDDEEPETWELGDPIPERLMSAVAKGVRVVAHNAGFECEIWNGVMAARHGWLPLPFEQMDCTAAMAAAMSLPRDLARAAMAMGLGEQKDATGRRLMLQMAKPRRVEEDGTLVWWDAPEKRERLLAYCVQDVKTERALHKKLRRLSAYERLVWILDHTINARGVQIDLRMVQAARRAVQGAMDALNRRLARITRNAVLKASDVRALKTWLSTQGVEMDSLDKAHVEAALGWVDPGSPAGRALLIRQEAGKSSVAKLDAMIARTQADGRSRETVMYHGAGTGRWSGRGIQLQNLPRPFLSPEDILLAFDALAHGNMNLLELFGSIPSVIADMLRGMVIARPGYELIRADYSNIEGRVLAWLAGEEWKLQAFRDFDAGVGPDLYLVAAAGIYGVPVESLNKKSPERQIGKVAELACGYGGGVGAFQSMAAVYRVNVPDDQADDIKTAWRLQHPATVDLWKALEDAAINAVENPGKPVSHGMVGWGDDRRRVPLKVAFAVSGNVLWCKLPSGRMLAYPSPRVEWKPTPWGKDRKAVTFMGMDDKNRWVRQVTYGGFWAENITQAVARDIMADAMMRCEYERGWPVVLTVHDEIVCEVRKGTVTVEEFENEMVKLAAIYDGLPITSEGDVGERYGK